MVIIMKCKEAEKAIPFFLEDTLENRDLKEFVSHIEECKECEEELSIQFLILEGMTTLEGGNVFDLQKELELRLEKARERLRLRRGIQLLIYFMEVLVVIAIIIIAFLIYFW
mgnify:CR=1 FL=1